MTNWFAKDALWVNPDANKHAGNKARKDVEEILVSLGWGALEVAGAEMHRTESLVGKIGEHVQAVGAWDEAFRKTCPGDVILLQFPLVNHSIFFSKAMRKACRRGVRFIGFIHDLDSLRFADGRGREMGWLKRVRTEHEEKTPLSLCSSVIAHNDVMMNLLTEIGCVKKDRIVSLSVFDYLCDAKSLGEGVCQDAPVAICGSLRPGKAGYVYQLPGDTPFNLYGTGFEGASTANTSYRGALEPEELVSAVEGSFGLVWDGSSAETCAGQYGSYLRINSPHKVSMYLTAGLPVIIWEEAALARLIVNASAGICISSLNELSDKIAQVTTDDYIAMKRGSLAMSEKLRAGYHTHCAVDKALRIAAGDY